MKAEGLSLSGDVNLQPFQFHPTRLKALPPGRSHVLDKGAFAFHFLCDKSGGRALYIVMLPHLSDISKIEVQAGDRYKLKVNTKKSLKKSSYVTMFGNPFARFHGLLFPRNEKWRAEKRRTSIHHIYFRSACVK